MNFEPEGWEHLIEFLGWNNIWANFGRHSYHLWLQNFLGITQLPAHSIEETRQCVDDWFLEKLMQIQQINPMIIVVLHILQELCEDLRSNFIAWIIEEILNVLLEDELVAFNIEILEERIDC